jgi:hypothetical protein
MKPALAAAALRFAVAAAALGPLPVFAQIVPITRCNAAIPCNIPYGLRPADAAGWTPGSNVGQGNTGISVSTDFTNGLVPKIDKPPVSEDPVEAAARMYVRKYPAPNPAPKPAATPGKSQGSSVEGRESKPKLTPTPAPQL